MNAWNFIVVVNFNDLQNQLAAPEKNYTGEYKQAFGLLNRLCVNTSKGICFVTSGDSNSM